MSTLETLYKTLWRADVQREVVLEVRRDGGSETVTVRSVDRAKTLSKPKGI